VTQRDFSRELGRSLRRPSWLPVPPLAVKLVVGELADVLMGGQRATPARLLAAGYAFRFPNIATALADLAASG
jgi:NAD dependent epimerase/dehydratase family enzyme